jgi:hypothetical protein
MDLVVERTFRLKSNVAVEVTARIFRPVAEGNDFRCSYTIDWPDKQENGRAYGVDSLQALLLAVQRLGVDVYCSGYKKRGDLVWLQEGGGFGLPLPKNLTDLYEGDDPPL